MHLTQPYVTAVTSIVKQTKVQLILEYFTGMY